MQSELIVSSLHPNKVNNARRGENNVFRLAAADDYDDV